LSQLTKIRLETEKTYSTAPKAEAHRWLLFAGDEYTTFARLASARCAGEYTHASSGDSSPMKEESAPPPPWSKTPPLMLPSYAGSPEGAVREGPTQPGFEAAAIAYLSARVDMRGMES
jgi:hypothetical protein